MCLQNFNLVSLLLISSFLYKCTSPVWSRVEHYLNVLEHSMERRIALYGIYNIHIIGIDL